jgi:hypothetical protein
MGVFSFVKAGKKVFEIVKPKIAKNLKKRFDTKQDIFKSVDEKAGKNVDASVKSKIKQDASKKVSAIYDKYEDATKKAKGGRIGLKSGTNSFAKKSNIKKIQETFGPKQVKKKEKPKVRMQAKKGSPDPKKKKKFPDLNKDGKTTFADVLMGRGVINGKKKPKKKFI